MTLGTESLSRAWRDDRPALLLLAGLVAAVVYLVAYFADYSHWFIHPHQFEIHLPMLLSDGPIFHLRDVGKIFQQFDPTENRPRFLAYLVILLNLHLRMWLYDWLVLYPPFSLGWIFELVIGPYLLYRVLRRLTGDRDSALAGMLVYLTSVGFLSGFAMPLAPSKPLTNVIFIAVLYVCSEIAKRAAPGELLLEVRGCARYRWTLYAILLAGLFLDEVPFFAFLLPVIVFRELFVPPLRDIPDVRRTVRNGMALFMPFMAFVFIVAAIVPRITQSLYGYRFNFFSSVLVNKAARETGKSFFSGAQYGFGLDSLWANLVSLVGTAVAPWQVAPLSKHPAGQGVITGFEPGPFVTSAVLGLVLGIALVFLSSRSRSRWTLGRAGTATLLFILFMSLLSGRHVPYISGYVYGCAFPVLFAVCISSTAKLLVGSAAGRWLVVVAACSMALVQIDNFQAINSNWIETHNEGWVKKDYGDRLHIADHRPLTRQEVDSIWASWKAGQLETYLASHQISAGAVFVVAELTWLEKNRPARAR